MLHAYRKAMSMYEREFFDAKIKDALLGDFCLQRNAYEIPYKIATQKIHPPALFTHLIKDGGMTKD